MDGKKGFEVPESTNIDYLISLGTMCLKKIRESKSSEYRDTYQFCGKPGDPPTNGGNGGCEGYGGDPGQLQIFGLANRSNIVLLKQSGKYQM